MGAPLGEPPAVILGEAKDLLSSGTARTAHLTQLRDDNDPEPEAGHSVIAVDRDVLQPPSARYFCRPDLPRAGIEDDA